MRKQNRASRIRCQLNENGGERSAIGNEFQIVGAAKVNERRPFAERVSGTVSKFLSRDHRSLEGM